MNTHTNKTIGLLLAATVAISAAFTTTGCNTLQKAQEDYPIAYDLLKGGAEIALTYYLGTTADSFVVENREALLGATRNVFAENEDPRDVALALTHEIDGIYPDDPATRDAIMRNLAVVLRSEPDPDTPASGPNAEAQSEYNADLADALDPPDEVASAPASEANEPVDYSLWGWLTSKETRRATKAYYAKPDPEKVEAARKLRALKAATQSDGTVDHETYRRLAL